MLFCTAVRSVCDLRFGRSLIVLGQLQRGRVSGDRVDCFAFREALYHVIEQYTVRLVVEPLGGHEIRVDRFRLTVDTCDQLLPLELGLFILHGIPHHGAHASGGLAPLVVCEADDSHSLPALSFKDHPNGTTEFRERPTYAFQIDHGHSSHVRQGDELVQISADGLQLLQHFFQAVDDHHLLSQAAGSDVVAHGHPGLLRQLLDGLPVCGRHAGAEYIDRYMMYLHDIRAFVPTIRNFIKFILSTLTTNGPESYAAALYGFYNDDRTAEKLIVNPITYHGDCYRRHDEYMLSYVPRELPDGSMAICQEHVTDSLQALMKADYMLALNSGHNIRRCIICGKYFMLKSGVHALYCEGACPHAPGYTCRQFGTVEVQKELAKNNPKVKAKLTAFSRITKDMQRGAISQEDARRAKDHVRDRLYDALRSPDISVEEFSEQISTAQVYEYCRITRVSKPRGRPPKAKAGGTHDQ